MCNHRQPDHLQLKSTGLSEAECVNRLSDLGGSLETPNQDAETAEIRLISLIVKCQPVSIRTLRFLDNKNDLCNAIPRMNVQDRRPSIS
jgi:hypothetical protein